MRNGVVALIMVIAMVSAFLAGLGSSTFFFRGNSTSGSTSSSTISTTCEILAGGEVILQVLNNTSGKPIPSAPVQAQVIPVPCGSNPQATVTLNTTLTNSTGFAVFGDWMGEYHLTLYAYGNYFVDASTLPEKTTCVTLSIPSGETQIRYSATFQFSC